MADVILTPTILKEALQSAARRSSPGPESATWFFVAPPGTDAHAASALTYSQGPLTRLDIVRAIASTVLSSSTNQEPGVLRELAKRVDSLFAQAKRMEVAAAPRALLPPHAPPLQQAGAGQGAPRPPAQGRVSPPGPPPRLPSRAKPQLPLPAGESASGRPPRALRAGAASHVNPPLHSVVSPRGRHTGSRSRESDSSAGPASVEAAAATASLLRNMAVSTARSGDPAATPFPLLAGELGRPRAAAGQASSAGPPDSSFGAASGGLLLSPSDACLTGEPAAEAEAQYVARKQRAIMRALAAAGADPTLTTTEVWRGVVERAGGVGPARVVGGFVTPLMAALRGSSDRGRFFLFNPDRVVEEQHALEAVMVAVELGADLEAADYSGTAVLHDAASRNLPSVVRFLADRGAVLDVKNGRGRTPLQLAVAASRRPRIVNVGAERSGETAADVLRELGAKESSR